MSRWFRLYAEVVDDPKVQRLPPHTFRAWINLLCVASVNNGIIPSIDDVAFRLRISTGDAQAYVDDLILAGLIDVKRSGALMPHNYETRQFISDSSSERVRKYRKAKEKNKRNGDETFHETPPEQNRTDSETETEEELNQKRFKKTAHFSSQYDAAREVKCSGQIDYIDLKVKRLIGGAS